MDNSELILALVGGELLLPTMEMVLYWYMKVDSHWNDYFITIALAIYSQPAELREEERHMIVILTV